MLYSENRKSRTQGYRAVVFWACASLTALVCSCSDSVDDRRAELTLDEFSDLRNTNIALSASQVREHLGLFLAQQHKVDTTHADRLVQKYYKNNGALVWVDRLGIDDRPQQLVEALQQRLGELGFSEAAFRLPEIQNRIQSLKTDSSINTIVAELEYYLSRAYLRYTLGQRYGYSNPYAIFNRRDVKEVDQKTGRILSYCRLYDADSELADDHSVMQALRYAYDGSFTGYFDTIAPVDTLYKHFSNELKTAQGDQRKRLLANMERRRWRVPTHPEKASRYVLVNLAAQQLWAVCQDSVMNMRVVCGALKTKTPLLSSEIQYMQVNPEWGIPQSIIKTDIVRHAGDSDYFARNRYYVVERKTGERVSPESVSAWQFEHGLYKVSQECGEGNSLGRLIFRFPNKFDVYLHDTSSRNAFNAMNRTFSHGCVRVQNPFDLATFVLGKADEWLLDRLRISMDIKPETDRGKKYLKQHVDDERPLRLVSWIPVEPHVPVFIIYYTLYPDPTTGTVTEWPDRYGYDEVVYNAIKPFI